MNAEPEEAPSVESPIATFVLPVLTLKPDELPMRMLEAPDDRLWPALDSTIKFKPPTAVAPLPASLPMFSELRTVPLPPREMILFPAPSSRPPEDVSTVSEAAPDTVVPVAA